MTRHRRQSWVRPDGGGRGAFTLIELLIVVAIVAILAAMAVVNFSHAKKRALISADASNLRTVAVALQSYYVDYNDLPPADREAGPFQSHGPGFIAPQNGPAAGGCWDGVPWILLDLKYLTDWKSLFCPKYLQLFSGPSTIRGNHPRYHNFRYAYNSSAVSSGGHLGGQGNIMSGTVWLVRDLWLPPEDGWWSSSAPDWPGDYTFPWGEGDDLDRVELAVYSGMGVRAVRGGTDEPASP